MFVLVPLLITILFGLLAFICFYYAFKPYEGGDEDYLEILIYDFGFFAILSMFFEFILWICRKSLPKNLYVFIFRVIAFVIGVLMIGVIFVSWLLFLTL